MNTISLTLYDGAATPFWVYLLLLIGIGAYAYRPASVSLSAFFVGAQRLDRLTVALSAAASGRSGWLLLGFSALAYNLGMAALWSVFGYLVVELLLFLVYAPKLRIYSEGRDLITVADFLVARLGDKAHLLRGLTAVIVFVSMLLYVSAQFSVGGSLFAVSFGVSYESGVLFSAGIILLYSILGGFWAVSWSDVLQAILMLLAAALLAWLALWNVGGWGSLRQSVLVITTDFTFFDLNSISRYSVLTFLGIGLGLLGSPQVLVRCLSIRSAADFPAVAAIGTVWNLAIIACSFIIGMVAHVYIPDLSYVLAGDTANIYPSVAALVLNRFLFGVVITSLFAAMMSAADAQLLVGTSALVRDVFQKILTQKTTHSEEFLVRVSRLTMFFVVVIAVILSVTMTKKVAFWGLFVWCGLGVSLGPVALLTLFWKGTTRQGAVTGLLLGVLSVFGYVSFMDKDPTAYELLLLPLFFIVSGSVILISFLTKRQTERLSENLSTDF